ncbi:small T antigen [Tadarida brasiliensis polyomavirus 1]|uniref:small T antigen n=1 Tax=Tadarida brasiliensis polyomavirus 1 TaxID=1588048 RepID=UPI000572A4F6|nr:small T antigen [Tadarida brasiliensis polyomavirus 1]AJA41152.1 small T antigen [Tadarida brasiliensis polyomavirus 1]
MDSLLEKHEREKLLQLLNLSPNCFSNFPIMKQAYKKASKRLHPDKGGNNEQMMLLNSLWHRYQEGLIDLRSSQVCVLGLTDLWDITLEEFYGERLKELLLKTPQCFQKGLSTCNCFCSRLNNQHEILKEVKKKKCLVWGECFCYFCFHLWYGLPHNWETFDLWASVIAQMPKSLLHLEASKYYFLTAITVYFIGVKFMVFAGLF